MLTLPEELLLLSLDDHGHSHDVSPANLDCGLLAAAVYELELRGRVALEDGRMRVVDASFIGDPELDETIKLLENRPSDETLESLLTSQYGKLKWVRDLVLEGLVSRGELRHEDGTLLWLVPQKRYAVEHGAEELSLLERLMRALILGEAPGRRTAALLTLTSSCFASDNHLRERMFNEVRDRMYEIVNSGGEVQASVRDSVCAALANRLPAFVA
jgi:hypothetical protein